MIAGINIRDRHPRYKLLERQLREARMRDIVNIVFRICWLLGGIFVLVRTYSIENGVVIEFGDCTTFFMIRLYLASIVGLNLFEMCFFLQGVAEKRNFVRI